MSQDKIVLKVEPRETTGKAVNKLRRDGQVPAVIHDHGKDSIIVQGDYIDMVKAYRQAGKHHAIELKAGDKTYTALIKVAEFEPRKNRLNHVVFNAVNKNQKVEAEIPIHPKYAEGNESSPAERSGLIVLSQLENVEVVAIPSKLPDFLEYNAEKLVEVGDHVTVADLITPEGVEIKTESTHAVATVYEPSALAAANDALAGEAEAADAEDVESEHESTAEEGTQEEEIRPGGKKEFEDKEQGHNPAKQ